MKLMTMSPTLHSDRLRLEPISDGHLPFLVGLSSDPEVMRFLTGEVGYRIIRR